MSVPLHQRGPLNHIMTIGERAATDEPFTIEKVATANFTPVALVLTTSAEDLHRVYLRQIIIGDRTQLREPVPAHLLEPTSGGPGNRGGFMPMLDDIKFGERVAIEVVAPANEFVSCMVSGYFDQETFLQRLMQTSRHVKKTIVGMSSQNDASTRFYGAREPGQHVVLPGEIGIIQSQPQMFFQAQWLAVAPECSEHFDIADIRIGKDSQSMCSAPIAASLFPNVPADADLATQAKLIKDFAFVSPGIIMTLSVTNRSAEPRFFRAAFHGLGLEL